MRSTSPLLLTFGLAAGVVVALVARPAGAAPDALRIATVDELELLASAPKRAQIEQDLKARTEGNLAWKNEQEHALDKIRGEALLMARTDPARKAKEHEFGKAKADFDFEMKWRLAETAQFYADALEAFHREVKAKIKEVAGRLGYSIVLPVISEDLQVAPSPEADSMWNDLAIKVATRGPIVYDPTTDITKQVKDEIAKSGGTSVRPGGVPPGPAPAGPGAVPPANPNPSGVPPANPNPGGTPPAMR
jgi:Skp family chaperone for outer membrane proteins